MNFVWESARTNIIRRKKGGKDKRGPLDGHHIQRTEYLIKQKKKAKAGVTPRTEKRRKKVVKSSTTFRHTWNISLTVALFNWGREDSLAERGSFSSTDFWNDDKKRNG